MVEQLVWAHGRVPQHASMLLLLQGHRRLPNSVCWGARPPRRQLGAGHGHVSWLLSLHQQWRLLRAAQPHQLLLLVTPSRHVS
jgi:hypothetical protein